MVASSYSLPLYGNIHVGKWRPPGRIEIEIVACLPIQASEMFICFRCHMFKQENTDVPKKWKEAILYLSLSKVVRNAGEEVFTHMERLCTTSL